jgi:glycosyltransferase involved in cell wall biosynthesis
MAAVSQELACVIISLRNQPGLARAVRSIYEQQPRPEIVVVNSDGGDPYASLCEAGLDVPVVNCVQRLLPGGARNLGIGVTRAPFVSFLAGDCTAEPGWVEARLHAHRAGADAVASVITNLYPKSRSATAAHLLLFHRRLTGTPPEERLFYGLSYDRRLFDAYGPFREDLHQGEDTELRARLDGHVNFAWAPGVRTAHDNPRRLSALLRDQYERGHRSPLYDELAAARLLKVLLYVRPSRAWQHARREPDITDRRQLLRAWPMIAPATAAYAAGVLSGRLRRPRSPDLTDALAPYRAEQLGA